MALSRVKTGVEGLDAMLNGGLVENRAYIVVGGPGAGKTILSMQFLMEGAKNGEPGLFLALEEAGTELNDDMGTFGWDLRRIKIVDTSQEFSGKWSIRVDSVIAGPELTLTNILNVLRDYITKYNIKRVVLDSLTSLKMMQRTTAEYRRGFLTLIKYLSAAGCTSLITIESAEDESLMEEFLASGVIKLGFVEHSGEWLHSVRVIKMRGMNFDQHTRPVKITEKGMTVFSTETMFS